jgi:predicted dinucleotide-binding enzyme
MKIGIIGSGNIGGELARKFRRIGHSVWITNSRGPASLQDFASETGAIASTITEVLQNSELVIVAITEKSIPLLPLELFSQLPPDVIIVDAGNYYPFRDGNIVELDDGLVESQWVSNHLGRPVLKAFNSILAQSLIDKELPPGHPDRIALPVAGDNAKDKQVLMDLVDSIGFDTVDSGPISESWRQQVRFCHLF